MQKNSPWNATRQLFPGAGGVCKIWPHTRHLYWLFSLKVRRPSTGSSTVPTWPFSSAKEIIPKCPIGISRINFPEFPGSAFWLALLYSGQVRPRQGTEICNFGAPSPLEALHWIFAFFSSIYVQFSKTSPLKSGESSEKSSGEIASNPVTSVAVMVFFGPDIIFIGTPEFPEISGISLERAFGIPELSGPILRVTARLSQRYPPYCALWGFWCLNMANRVRYPLPLFLSVSFPLGEHAKWRCDTPPPPTKGYLSDTCAIPYETRQNASAILSRKGIARYGRGILHWAAKSPNRVFGGR